MKTNWSAKELLVGYLENINNPEVAIELFAEDARIELPYLNSLGMSWRWQGKSVLLDFLKTILVMFPGFGFQNIQILIATDEQAFGEFEVHCRVAALNMITVEQSMVSDNDGKLR